MQAPSVPASNAIMLFVTQSDPQPAKSTIAVVGLGYVGCVTAACLAHLGHRVVGIDRDRLKVENVRRGKPPFYEPELDRYVEEGQTSGLLTATTDMAEGIQDADVALLCVGTPSSSNGDISLDQLRRVCLEIAPALDARTKPLVVAVRSTVFPGTCEQVIQPALNHHSMAPVVSNPEFLREGCAVKDFMEPSLLVVGGACPEAAACVANLYQGLPVEACIVSLRTAEMIKYACNAFHAVKIGFANEIGAVSSQLGVDGEEVMSVLCKDVKLNASAAYLRPGFAFGGSCLPKDLRAITYRALRLDVKAPLLESVLPSNDAHLQRAITASLSFGEGPIGVYGLAFKENTDDLRESPVITLIEQLIGKGRDLRIYDPHIRIDSIYGSNRQFLLSALPHVSKLLVQDLPALLNESRRIILAQKPHGSDLESILASRLPTLDLQKIPASIS